MKKNRLKKLAGDKRFIAYLDRLREDVEKNFPAARSFIRPGFDKIDLNG